VPRKPASAVDAPARERLTRATIVQAAIAIADADGMDAVTMRRLADDLGVVPTAIYWHLRSRNEVLQEMMVSATGELQVPDPDVDADWVELAREASRSLRTLLLRHRWVLPLVSQFPGVGVGGFVDAMLRIGEIAGFDTVESVKMARLVGTHVVGSVVFADEGEPDVTAMPDIAGRDRLTFVAEYVRLDTSAVFEQGLGYILDGLRRDWSLARGVDTRSAAPAN
jgi:AcrR family transcriptional regulator